MTHVNATPELGGHLDPRSTTHDPDRTEGDTAVKQGDGVLASETAKDPDVDDSQVEVLPGTGGPDDVGDIEVDPSELNLSGDSIPGHPKPGSPEDR